MICLTRLLAKQLRAAFRRTLQLQHSTLPHIVWIEGSALGLRVWSRNQHGAVEYRRAGTFPAERLPISVAVLAACEGTKATDTIELERQASGQVVVRWQDRGVPQSLTVESSETDCEPVPSSPTDWSDNSPGLVTALADAMEITDTSSSRWALSSIQLRGSGGRIAATDSTQMLVQNGFEFPWSEDVLVPRTTVFRQRDLWCDQRLRVGRTPEHVAFQSGPWTVWLAVHKDGRFPVVENIIPDAGSASTRMHIAEEDVDFLVNTVPRLPCDDSSHKPLTVDLNGHVALLARAADTSPVTRAVLSNGQRDGDELRWHTNRDYLLRAVQLGFREIELFGNEAPAVCRDAHRVYVWSLLPAADALVAGDNPIELASPLRPNTPAKTAPVVSATTAAFVRPVASSVVTPTNASPTSPIPDRRTTKMPPTNRIAATLAGIAMPPQEAGSVSHVAVSLDTADQPTHFGSVLHEAESLKTTLREAHSKVSSLIVALKRQRRQSKLVQTTLASLKQLQTLDA